MCVITGDGGKGKGSLSQDLQYKDPIITKTYRYRAVVYYCSRTSALVVALQTFLATTELASYIIVGHKNPPVNVRGKGYNVAQATIHLSSNPHSTKREFCGQYIYIYIQTGS